MTYMFNYSITVPSNEEKHITTSLSSWYVQNVPMMETLFVLEKIVHGQETLERAPLLENEVLLY